MSNANISGLDLNLLLVLDALLAESSVSKAASRLGSTQPSVSRALAQLRLWFEDPLFVRSRHGLAPTPRAEVLRAELRGALEQLRHVVERRDAFVPATSNRVFNLTGADYAQLLVVNHLAALLGREAPQMAVHVQPWSLGDLVDSLEMGHVDLAIGPSLARSAPLRAAALFSDDFVVIARRGHPSTARGTMTLEQFVRSPQVQIAPDGRKGGIVDDALAARGLARHVALRIPSFAVAPMVVSSSDYVAVVPRRLAMAASMWPLEMVRLPLPLPTFTLCMFWHERAHADPTHAWLRGRVASIAARYSSTTRSPGRADETTGASAARVAPIQIDRRAAGTL